jgi:hypothetical protein
MLVFISWSGDRSKAVAQVLAEWLSKVVQATDARISSDISKGVRCDLPPLTLPTGS